MKHDIEWLQSLPQRLYTGVISDVLDQMGFRHQAMNARLRPLDPDNCMIVGRARTFRWMDTDHVEDEDPYGLEIEAMDALRPGDVVVHSTDFSGVNAPWGELMTAAGRARGAVGCICDSQIRDGLHIKQMGFPVFLRGICPVDSLGRARVMSFDVPIRCGGVLVQPGDLIFADFDGVMVIPNAVEEEVVRRAEEKAAKETSSRTELLNGKTLREVFDTYGVL